MAWRGVAREYGRGRVTRPPNRAPSLCCGWERIVKGRRIVGSPRGAAQPSYVIGWLIYFSHCRAGVLRLSSILLRSVSRKLTDGVEDCS